MNNPRISVIMPCYNRKDYVSTAIESILTQSYKDFELIIIDDASTDGTSDIIKKYEQQDSRIKYLRNKDNKGLIYNLNKGLEAARGEYIARMDDDDISLPERFQKQIEFLDKNPDVTVLGTFIETFGDAFVESWIKETDPDVLKILLNFHNPMCHPSIMMRHSFLKQHNLKYSYKGLHAEEYYLWKNIILKGGKLANLPEVLLRYRTHKSSISKEKETSKIQLKTAKQIRLDLLSRYYPKKIAKKKLDQIYIYPFSKSNKKILYETFEKIGEKDLIAQETIQYLQNKYCGKNQSDMHIFFAANDKFSTHLCVTIASILYNSIPNETFNFYILDGGISKKNKQNIYKLSRIKTFNIEFIQINDDLFTNCVLTADCKHITKQTYYRYLIPKIKPELEKTFYFDCDIVVESSLSEFWNTPLENYYCAVVEELYKGSIEDQKRLNIGSYFNAGIMLINNRLWVEENISETLFNNTIKLKDKIKWVDQDVLNYTFDNKVKFVSPKYNLQQSAFFEGKANKYSHIELEMSKITPTIIHFNGYLKPWDRTCNHPLWKRYYKYLKLTPYSYKYPEYWLKKFSKKIFSKEKFENKKIIKILGLKLTFNKKRKVNKHFFRTISKLEETMFEFNKQIICNSNYWNPAWYLKEYNYRFNKFEAFKYWYYEGWKKNERPSCQFNTEYYINKYNIKDENPLLHFLTKGQYWCLYTDICNNYASQDDIVKINTYLDYKKTRTSKSVCYICITNSYDDIEEIKAYKYINPEWDYVCFTDNEEDIKKKQIGIWEIRPLVYTESSLTGNNRWHKMNPHLLFPEYDESIYIDANINILTPKLFENIRAINSPLVLPEHYSYNCIYFELSGSINAYKKYENKIQEEINFLKTQGMPSNYGFTENNILYRKHNLPEIQEMMKEWWEIFNRYAPRDQFSFTYLLYKHGIKVEDITFKNSRLDHDNFYVFDHKKGKNHECSTSNQT